MPPTDNYTPYISYFQALILGLVQGVTEFLPVSSTAHMRILPALLNHFYPQSWPNDTGAAFSAIAQLGPMVGIIAYFRKDLARYLAGSRTLPEARQAVSERGTRTHGWPGMSCSRPCRLS